MIVAGTKASNALRRRCAEMHILDPLRRCNLFDMLAKPILSYGCEIWGVNPKAGEKAELLNKSILRNILRVPKTGVYAPKIRKTRGVCVCELDSAELQP